MKPLKLNVFFIIFLNVLNHDSVLAIFGSIFFVLTSINNHNVVKCFLYTYKRQENN